MHAAHITSAVALQLQRSVAVCTPEAKTLTSTYCKLTALCTDRVQQQHYYIYEILSSPSLKGKKHFYN
jgi:hypothetical protein